MAKKQYQIPENKNITISEPAVPYNKLQSESLSSPDNWNPNKPFHGTQEEWWDHFHEIEKGPFYPAEEVHQRIAKWLESRKR